MNILILGDGPDELLWARAVLDHPEHHLVAACPGFKGLPDVPGGNALKGITVVTLEHAIAAPFATRLRELSRHY